MPPRAPAFWLVQHPGPLGAWGARTASQRSEFYQRRKPTCEGRGGRSSDLAETHVVPAPYSDKRSARTFAELLIDCEENPGRFGQCWSACCRKPDS